jgi:hypothetical protein
MKVFSLTILPQGEGPAFFGIAEEAQKKPVCSTNNRTPAAKAELNFSDLRFA